MALFTGLQGIGVREALGEVARTNQEGGNRERESANRGNDKSKKYWIISEDWTSREGKGE